jgi:hypothetical protein
MRNVTIPAAITLTAFGVFGNQPATGVNGIMALYADDGSICTDNAATNQIDFVTVFPYGVLPSPFRDVQGGAAARVLMQTIDINFYLAGDAR